MNRLALRLEPLAWILLGGMVALVAGMSARRWLGFDELEAMQTAWKMVQGEKIYVEFYQIHHPFTYYLLYPLLSIFGEDFAVFGVARFLFFLQLVGIYAVVYHIGRELGGGRAAAVLGAFFLAAMTIFTQANIEVRPDVPMTLFGLLGVYLLLRYLRLRQTPLLVGSGLCLCLSFLFLQKAAILILLLGPILGLRLVQRDVSLRELAVFGGTMLAGLVPYAAYLMLDGTLGTFLFYNFTVPKLLYELKGPEHWAQLGNAVRLLAINGVIVLLFVAGLALVQRDRRQWEVVFIGLGWLAWVVLSGRTYPQYYNLFLPVMAIVAAQAVEPLLRNRPRLLAAALLLAFALPAQSYGRHIASGRAYQMAQLAYVHRVAGPGDYVYDGRMRWNVFRRDTDFLWYYFAPNEAVEPLQALLGYRFDPYEQIERYKPAVISDVRIDVRDPRIAANYEPAPPGYEGMYVRRDRTRQASDARDTRPRL